MANVLKITVDNPDEILNAGAYGAGAVLRVQSATAEVGPFTDVSGTGSTPTIPIVSGTTAYDAYDPNGATDTWYRTRYENAGATRASDWSAAFQVGRQFYADLADLKEMVNPPDDSRDNLLLDLLEAATDGITELCERDFFAHPQSGEETRLMDGTGARRLRVKAGILSLSQVRLATKTGGSLEILAASEYIIGPTDKRSDEPYEWLWLMESSATLHWYSGIANVELTGRFGWPRVPTTIRQATLDLARELYRQGPGGALQFAPGQLAVYRDPKTGEPLWGTGLPPSVITAFNRYSARSVMHAGAIVSN